MLRLYIWTGGDAHGLELEVQVLNRRLAVTVVPNRIVSDTLSGHFDVSHGVIASA